MSTSAKGKKSVAEEINEKFQRNTKTKEKTQARQEQKEDPFANIKENPFFKLMTSDEAPEAKREQYEKAITYDETKTEAENKAMREASQQFKDWLAEYRKQIIKELILLADTESAAELQGVIEEMNTAMMNFEDLIDPMMSALKAIHTLNKESGGQMYEVFREIDGDRQEQERIEAIRVENEEKITRHEQSIKTLKGDIAELNSRKRFLGLLGPSAEDIAAAARKQVEIDSALEDIVDIREQTANLKSERETKFGEFAHEKEELAKFLELSSDENRGRQEAIRDAVMNYVQTMDDKSANVLGLLTKRKGAIEEVDSTVGKMQRAYTIIQEAELNATKNTAELAQKFNDAAEDESPLQKMEREQTLDAINEHVTVLADTAKSTTNTLVKVAEEAVQTKSLKDNNRRAIRDTKELNESGVASMGGRLITTMESFAQAALNEGKATILNTMSVMDDKTRELMKEDVIQAAAAMHVENDRLAEALKKTTEIGETGEQAIQIQRAAIGNYRSLAEEANETINRLKEMVQESKGLDTESYKDGENLIPSRPKAKDQDNDAPKGPSFGGLGGL
ncbi:MAG: hypothetical protein H6867_05060 [Rhodospirillales bacterium]|nr:hypothetical protein [Rhodospirillales bacterium]MCB9994897.1 hypothetical protein [Rhodospirillales bacterium]